MLRANYDCPVRVAFDEQIFAIQRYGGISRVFAELAREFESDPTHEVELQPIAAPVVNEYLLRDAETARKLDVWRGTHWSTTIARSLARRRHHGPADVVHSSFYLPRMYKDYEGAKRIVTVHDMIPELFPSTRRRLDFMTMKHAYVQQADHVICVSESTRRDLQTIYPDIETPVSVVYSGVGEEFVPGLPPIPGLPDEYVLYVGARLDYKDSPTLIKGFAGLASEFPHLMLMLVGGGSLSRSEAQLAREVGIEKRIVQVSLPDSDMPRAYGNARAFVFPSRYEGFGLPVLEAMASGTPAVLCDSSALPEVGGEAAVYFRMGDPEDLARAVNEVLTDSSLRDKLVHQGIERARHFSWANTAQRTADVYRAVVEDSEPS
jgi:glycosyltransferase involved in cell wall biosynthesis